MPVDGNCSLLPLPGERWVARRKAMVITALRDGEATIEEICQRYSLSPDELASWISSFERYGVPGLRTTRVQIYRDLERVTATRSSAARFPASVAGGDPPKGVDNRQI